MHSSVPIISVLMGCALLFFGRRLFWLLLAALGFAIGLELAPYLSQNPPLWLSLLLSIVLGLLGALLAVMLQKLAIGIAGFLVGGRVAVAVAVALWVNSAQHSAVITFVIGGIVGAILFLALFDWALIVFSAIEGARLITGSVHLPSTGATVLVVALAVFGIFVQAAMFRGGRRTG